MDVLKLLFEKGVGIEGQNELLWQCARPGNEEVVRLLVQKGLNPDAPTGYKNGETARQKAEKTFDTLLLGALEGR